MARILKIGRDEWKREKGYNRRWKAECTFSDDKRLFGDTLSSRKLETDVEETVMKVLLLNEYKQIRMRCQEVKVNYRTQFPLRLLYTVLPILL